MNNDEKSVRKNPTQNETSPQTTIWDELNEWGKGLDSWKRFILSYAVRDSKLNPNRVDEVYKLFLRHAKLDTGTEEVPSLPPSITGRGDSGTNDDIFLKGIKSLKGVNAIPETSELTFGENLTIVYGHNGAGKSGFVKILSAACFCRSEHTNIINNVFKPPSENIPASAEFILIRGSEQEESICFTVGNEIEELQRICVFDSSVAHTHLNQENVLSFQPAGFDVFNEMIRVIKLIENKLENDIRARNQPNNFKNLFLEKGQISEKIEQINADTNIEDLESLSIFGKAENERLEEVIRQEAEARNKSSEETLKILSRVKSDITNLSSKIRKLLPHLNENACKSAFTLLEEHKIATDKTMKAGAEAVKHENLHKTGSPVWDKFVEASRNLGQAESESYPQVKDPCLLCHRPLDQSSTRLIKQMWTFLDDSSRRTMLDIDAKINKLTMSLNNLDLILLPLESRIRSDFLKVIPESVEDLDNISNALIDRRDIISHALVNNSGNLIPKDDIALPTKILNDVVIKVEKHEKALREGRFAEILANLQMERVNLKQRQILNKNIDAIKSYIRDLKWIKEASTHKRSSLNTRFVSDKHRILFRTHIVGSYTNYLNRECEKLNCVLSYNVKTRGREGRTLRELKVQNEYSPEDIFSEGEQRALALADFLTEINLSPSSAAIILDDPVTSMDHKRKKEIAIRLANEATKRQVIVFTHDLVFFSFLSNHAENNQIACEQHWIERHDDMPGYVNLGEAPIVTKGYRNTTEAMEVLKNAKEASGNERVSLVRKGAGVLRKTLEVIIVHYLFKDVVQRWNEQIHIGALNKIHWSNELANEIIVLRDDISRLIEGHSNSEEFAGETPSTDNLEKLIIRVNDVREKAKKQRKNGNEEQNS